MIPSLWSLLKSLVSAKMKDQRRRPDRACRGVGDWAGSALPCLTALPPPGLTFLTGGLIGGVRAVGECRHTLGSCRMQQPSPQLNHDGSRQNTLGRVRPGGGGQVGVQRPANTARAHHLPGPLSPRQHYTASCSLSTPALKPSLRQTARLMGGS